MTGIATVRSTDLLVNHAADFDGPGFVRSYALTAPHHRPIFTQYVIPDMMTDPRICFGLELIKGPIHSNTKFFTEEEAKDENVHKYIVESGTQFPYVVNADKKEIADYVASNLKRFWQTGAIKALSAIEWGYSGHEVIYKQTSLSRNKKVPTYDNLYSYQPNDVRVVSVQGGITGIEINPSNYRSHYLGMPKSFWHVHARDVNRYYGQSRLRNAYAAWWEIWTEGGARDVRRQWYYRNAYDGGIVYYPIGKTEVAGGQTIENRDLALEMLSKKRAGGYFVFPNQEQNGKQAWQYEPPVAGVTPQGLPEYMNSLTDEELEGLGIPPEIVQGGDGGLGSSSGRKIPMMAYYSSLQKISDFLISDFLTQILQFTVPLAFPGNKTADYEVVPLIPVKAYEDGINDLTSSLATPSSQENDEG